jgi:hypothetical protein
VSGEHLARGGELLVRDWSGWDGLIKSSMGHHFKHLYTSQVSVKWPILGNYFGAVTQSSFRGKGTGLETVVNRMSWSRGGGLPGGDHRSAAVHSLPLTVFERSNQRLFSVQRLI